MQDLFEAEGVALSEQQTELICRGLLDLAAVDGVHESELALVVEFAGGDGDLAALQAMGFDAAEAATALRAAGDEAVEAFFVSCYLLIYADGHHSPEEAQRIGEYAEAFGLSSERQEALHLKSRLYLLGSIAKNLRNRDAVRMVGQSLGLAEDQIARAMEG